MNHKFPWAISGLVFWLSVAASATPLQSQDLILAFDGKGVAMAWDLGVAQALQEKLRPGAVSNIYYVGSSSGSIMSTYFACHGFTATSVQNLWQSASLLPKDVLDQAVNHKMVQLFLGVPPEISPDGVSPIIDIVTDHGSCLPSAPLLIVASNLDVLEGRNAAKPFSGRHDRQFDAGTFVMSENGKVLGKTCTYFVNDAMAKVLSAEDPTERLCDVRPMQKPSDVRLAIVASISEPTYFPTVPDPNSSLVSSIYPVTKRLYRGGFVIDSPVQDVKRVLSQAWIVSTGHPAYSRIENRIISNWFSFPLNLTLLDQHWWPDVQIPINNKMWSELLAKKTSPREQANWGLEAARRCFSSEKCLPQFSTRPRFGNDVRGQSLDGLRQRGLQPLF